MSPQLLIETQWFYDRTRGEIFLNSPLRGERCARYVILRNGKKLNPETAVVTEVKGTSADERVMQEGSEKDDVNLFNFQQSLFEKICSVKELESAFKTVRRNCGAPSVEGVTVEIFDGQLSRELSQLKKDLESWTYKPKPVRQVEIPKPNGGIRLFGIPTVLGSSMPQLSRFSSPLSDHSELTTPST